MKKLLAVALAGVLAGCQSAGVKINSEADISANTKLEVVNREAMKDGKNIELPSNYDVKAFNKLRIVAYVDRIDFEKDALSTEIDNSIIAKLLENELDRTKRFEVLTRNCPSCDYEIAYQAENTVAEGSAKVSEQLNPDFILESSISLGTTVKKKSDHNELIFRSLITTKIVDPSTRKIIHSFAPIRENMDPKRFFAFDGKFLGGFDYRKANELQEAYKEVAEKGIQLLVNQVMNYYPVGGRVTDYISGHFVIDAGIDQGFAVKQPVVLVLDGLDIPVASAEVTPKANGGSGNIWSWKKGDPVAEQTKKMLEAMGKEYLQRNKIYAVSVGAPEDWKR